MMDRRSFLKAAAVAAVPGSAFAASYGLFEAAWVEVVRVSLPLPRLPHVFDGLRVAFLTDIHHGPFTSLNYVRSVVRTALALQPDLIVLGGDYSLKDRKYIRPCFDVLAALKAPLGVFGVLGDHDYWHGLEDTRAGFAAAEITELTNRGVWLERGGYRLRLAGVDDLWYGKVDVKGALAEATAGDACLLVSHNPDVAERLRDPRVGLMLSGHTHGGQVVLPNGSAPFVPSHYGQKYLRGVCQAPATTVYVSRGLGCTSVPVRFGSRPELTLITLTSS
jgi:predicted MPP superfamily phosphohydrolase